MKAAIRDQIKNQSMTKLLARHSDNQTKVVPVYHQNEIEPF
jgi:hypothetical protein